MDIEELKKANKHNWKLKVGILGISLFFTGSWFKFGSNSHDCKIFPK